MSEDKKLKKRRSKDIREGKKNFLSAENLKSQKKVKNLKKSGKEKDVESESSQKEKSFASLLKEKLQKEPSPSSLEEKLDETSASSSLREKLKQASAKNKQIESESTESIKDQEKPINQKLKKALDDNLYLRAEFENFKRQFAEERKRLIRYGGENFISSLANEVLDDLDRAMAFSDQQESIETLKEGLKMIQKKLSQVFNQFGIEVLDPTGKAFDPSYQEALSYVKTSEVPEDHVVETFKKAYKFQGKVIRPAQVVLAKRKEES